MDSPLLEVWHGASASPFLPTIGKGTQFPVAFLLLLIGFTLTGAFTLNRSIINLPLLGIPASLAFAYVPVVPRLFGVVYMFCAVGVYV
ncbi:hypothetical protein SMAC4_13120 [Sordaria macrospora]|uniref:uncharacterized protein n=1 Tax=Sordaria macrospora TaxID=5147 RepID=UPI002B2D7D82|nr:hypothetical protein SMAC4_13120 [Sordaria macrospora]